MWKNFVVLVTGGASGLGKATVERVVKNGGKAVVCDLLTLDRVKSVGKSYKSCVVVCPADVTSESDVEKVIQRTKNEFGRLDVVINCAGIGVHYKMFDSIDKRPHKLDDFVRTWNVNAVGSFNVTRLAVGLMAENDANQDGSRGVVINVASIAAFEGQIGQVAYAASKAAIVGMTLPLARELSSVGIRVCCIAPGIFQTPMISKVPDDMKAVLCRSVPHPGRFGKPEEFALLVEMIVSNPLLNGVTIRLDGATRLPAKFQY